ncbi:osmotically inducible lipoprotein OsmB [Chromobacterium alkanivorans]|jgi:osmotically inducible lipoprotein OsmB|uniref:glycine zipper 2TM domain-containing protein n=1 Tax=Chromobacterium TaxID=535 RepID=UPI0006533A5A|nr:MULTISPECIES: glycine zipper 2TM domain-containing protein [Chromobacterium]KMN82762.1 lipoprotein [Chromobacterium sp. LK11]MBN3005273.1 osmotically-inducible lipoprotein OsmB [Chromobacterium alkanivorans]MCS3804521.1 osmotically inducible lipoprotein OsmB [Chromobacterium alkanivorans]MCS3818860.1 osmotically inducible lipoprotein OsmB [Chromobacterium alkanivorans]MCS3873282.1 osmotically inducible lipoprotein OsmB [Chromobacterium alkanivorans]
MTSITSKPAVKAIAASLLAVSLLSGCANMSKRQQNTAIGAAAGAVLGSVLTGGDAIGTVGGAAVGGVVGNQTGKR